MFSTIWHTIFFDPVYNLLVFFIDVIPNGDVGLAIVCTVVVVKVILLPLSLKASRTQVMMREIEPKLKEIQEKFKDNREKLARATMDLYKESGVNPFSSILLLFIQIPLVIALYFSVYSGGGVALPEINTDLLYSFIPVPITASMIFIGIIDIAARNLPLALLAGITQYVHTSFLLPERKKRDPNAAPNFKEDFAHSMHIQMKYVMPIIIFVVAYSLSATIALYFVISNIVAIAQEYVVKRERAKMGA
ncbi:YidC/Oxa1 family membrane protein insertase [Candidatus Kaiserbacteria bacterium]|nr:YidC/Oxa1 family membrane protein insertase [Candidatus Kaiserbacteria bacterium]